MVVAKVVFITIVYVKLYLNVLASRLTDKRLSLYNIFIFHRLVFLVLKCCHPFLLIVGFRESLNIEL